MGEGEETRKPGQHRKPGERMKAKHAKEKGRRLQQTLAEMLSGKLHLTIEATLPRQIGLRADGVEYVSEAEGPDLRVKRMGEPGADVVLVTERAKRECSMGMRRTTGIQLSPIWWECKNTEGWDLAEGLWRTGSVAMISDAMEQALGSAPKGYVTVVVLGKNRWPPLAVFHRFPFNAFSRPVLVAQDWLVTPLEAFLRECIGPRG